MCNILLADEINRASPKTQSSLLEAMNDGRVTVDGTAYLLPDPFMVIATQNPLGFVGTYHSLTVLRSGCHSVIPKKIRRSK